MSKTITITGIYRNGKRNIVGLHDSRNIDMANIQFEASELINKAANYFAGRIFKKFQVDINVSDSKGNSQAIFYELPIIGDNSIKAAIDTVNNF